VGDPKDEKSNLGAVVSKPHMQKILKTALSVQRKKVVKFSPVVIG